eukprot:9481263-Pyramimonas_sp.AAC.1
MEMGFAQVLGGGDAAMRRPAAAGKSTGLAKMAATAKAKAAAAAAGAAKVTPMKVAKAKGKATPAKTKAEPIRVATLRYRGAPDGASAAHRVQGLEDLREHG